MPLRYRSPQQSSAELITSLLKIVIGRMATSEDPSRLHDGLILILGVSPKLHPYRGALQQLRSFTPVAMSRRNITGELLSLPSSTPG
jgi:hypothetical protein